jgi:hypothetical protein
MSHNPISQMLLLTATLLVGCERIPESSRFQLVSSDAHVYRIDTMTGKVSKVDSSGITAISEQASPLVIGEVYLFESGERMKYLGKGKFGSAVTVSNW